MVGLQGCSSVAGPLDSDVNGSNNLHVRTVKAGVVAELPLHTTSMIFKSLLSSGRRGFAAISTPPPISRPPAIGPFQVFDRGAKQIQKDRAATRDGGQQSRTVDYVRDEIADRMMERLFVRSFQTRILCAFCRQHLSQDIKRKFNTILDLGSGPGHFAKLLEPEKTNKIVMLDLSCETCFLHFSLLLLSPRQNVLQRRPYTVNQTQNSGVRTTPFTASHQLTLAKVEVERIHADEEQLLDVLGPNSQEAVVSCLGLHWINDLPGIQLSSIN
jgi:NADH dehydrogenase [ubiquinone] 1 alpha subcomplex assembly factor 5